MRPCPNCGVPTSAVITENATQRRYCWRCIPGAQNQAENQPDQVPAGGLASYSLEDRLQDLNTFPLVLRGNDAAFLKSCGIKVET